MDTMRVAVVTEPYKVEIQQRPVPACGPGDVLIQTVCAGVCGSDLHLFKGTHPFRQPPAVLGHEIAGEVVRVGAAVQNIRPGDRVTVLPHVPCDACEFCKLGKQNLCTAKRVPGTPAWCGTFAEYFVAPERCVFRINDGVSYELGILAEPLAVAVHAVNQIKMPAASIAILGTGTIGLLCAIVAREKGFKCIYCTDTAPFNLSAARAQGAQLALNPVTDDVPGIIRAHNGGGVDVTLVCAGAPGIIDQASEITKRLGQIVLVAMITEKIPVYTYSFVFDERTLTGAMTYQDKDFEEAMGMINSGLDLSFCVTQRLPFDKTGDGLSMLDRKEADVIKILVYPGDAPAKAQAGAAET